MNSLVRSPRQLGTLIHNARQTRGLTQEAVADLVGTGQKTISRLETGHPGLKLETLLGVVAALDLDLTLEPRRKGSADLGKIF